jgi:hypothetical protein
MSSFDIDVTRDGGRWTVHIREVNGPAQGRTVSEAPASQRSKRHSGQVGEQLVDPALLQRQRDRRA